MVSVKQNPHEPYTDLENKVFSKIAYFDLADRFEMYQRMGYERAPLEEILTTAEKEKLKDLLTKEEKEKLKDACGIDIENGKYGSWSISGVHDANLKNGMYACVIETEPPRNGFRGRAAVAFRGSETSGIEDYIQDWAHADVGLLNSDLTSQQKEVDRFLKKNADLLGQYDLSSTGHSLGGNLSEYFTIVSDEYGLDDNIIQCTSLDGPGFSHNFIKQHRDQIDKMGDRMTHYTWSIVGGLLHHLPIGEDHYKYLISDEKGGGPVMKHCLEYLIVEGDSFVINEEGYHDWERDVRGLSEIIDAGAYVDGKLMHLPAAAIAIQVFGAATFAKVVVAAVVLGAIGSIISDITGYSSFDEFFASRYQRKASSQVEKYQDFEIDYVEYQRLAKECDSIASDLQDIIDDLEKFKERPSMTIDIPDNILGDSIIEGALTAIYDLFAGLDDLVGSVGQSVRIAKKAKKTLKGVSAYLSQTGDEFELAEKLAKRKVEEWMNQMGISS